MRTHLRRLRQKLGDGAANPAYIHAEARVGYRMPNPKRHNQPRHNYQTSRHQPNPPKARHRLVGGNRQEGRRRGA